MTSVENATLEKMIHGHVTSHVVDRHVQLAARAYARARGIESEFQAILLKHRFAWISRLGVWQREWQCRTRRQSRAKHHDSVSIRERYVRCQSS